MRSMIMPPRNDSAMASSAASPIGTSAWVRPQATKVLNIAISPWAKLTMPGRRGR